MIVCVKSVLLIGLLATATSGLSTLSPEHVHALPNNPVTFTCRADKEVAACEFLVSFEDKELVVVNPAQARSGSWDIGSYGGQGSDIPAQESTKSRAAAPEKQRNQQSSVQREEINEETHSTTRNKNTGTINAADRSVPERQNYESVASQTTANRVDGEVVPNLIPAPPGERKVGVPRTNLPGIMWPRTDTERSPPSVDLTSRLASTSSANAKTSDCIDRQNLSKPPVNPRGATQQNKSGRVNSTGKHRFTVLSATDATQGPAAIQRAASPYPANYTKFCRRPHGWKLVFPAVNKAVRVQPTLRSRVGNDEYQWEASSSKDVCTLTLPAAREGRHLIGCRTRLAEGGWQYATSSMDVNSYQSLGLTVTVPTVVNPDSEVNVVCKSTTRMRSCHVNGTYGTLRTPTECRVKVRAESRPIWCTAVSETGRGSLEARPAFVRVRTIPTRLDFAIPKTRFMEGEYFTATCAVGPLQPPAPNVTWYIGEELLRADSDDDIPDSKWVWPWEGLTVRQSLFMTVTAEDDNEEFACQVDHPDLRKTLRKSARLHVNQDIDDGTKNCGLLPGTGLSERLLGGKKVEQHLPWVASIYRRRRGAKFEQECGGTLVTRRLVVSSAQCFWDATYSRLADPSNFRVALGSLGRDWTPSDESTQHPGIVRIAVPRHYIGRTSFFAYDIAVLVLDSPVTITEKVLPVCIDRTGELPELQPGDIGKVAGWGVTETGYTSPVLRSIELPYVHTDDCFRDVNGNLHRYITYDKFCAGYRNRSKSVCPGDSGGGLIFFDPDSERHYLRGIASVAFTPIGNDENCYADLYTGFTLVSEYTQWIFKQAPPPPTAA